MTIQFLFEDGKGNVASEEGNDPMDMVEDSENGVQLKVLGDKPWNI
jgi:hypothetical protein